MNSFTGNPSPASSSQKTASPSTFSSYQFDFGLGPSGRNSSKPLKDQKPNPAPAAAPRTTPSWTLQPNKPAWTHQPAPTALNGPTSMVGDIFGKSWGSAAAAPSSATTASIGITPKNNPNLFSDLVGSALKNGGAGGGNVPLKAAAPAKGSYSMGSLAENLPKSSNTNASNGDSSMNFGLGSAGNSGSKGISSANSARSSWGSGESFGNFSSLNQSNKPIGGQPVKSMAGMGAGVGSNQKEDPFGTLMNFRSKTSGSASLNSSNAKSSFGDFQNAKAEGSGMSAQNPAKTHDFSFGEFKNAESSNFDLPSQTTVNLQGADPLDSLFSSSGNATGSSVSQQFNEMNDWDVEFGGQDHNETTTELEGLPPPPAGVTSSMAKTKGIDNYKQGQFADAIKWLSWAIVLIEKNGESAEANEVYTCRASCYKEVGEYKKAVADCTKVLEQDTTNVSVLVQRALLYESTEKYRLGADDLRMVLKIDPSNRVARSTIHRLNKMAG